MLTILESVTIRISPTASAAVSENNTHGKPQSGDLDHWDIAQVVAAIRNELSKILQEKTDIETLQIVVLQQCTAAKLVALQLNSLLASKGDVGKLT